jgi:hypothetical protein
MSGDGDTRTWTCDLTTIVRGSLSSLAPSTGSYANDYFLPCSLLNQVCKSAGIDATISTNLDGSNRITLDNNGSSDVWQTIKLSVIRQILERYVFRKSPEQIEDKLNRKEGKLKKVINYNIFDFSSEGPEKQLCLFIFSKKTPCYLSLMDPTRMNVEDFNKMMRKFRDSLK